VKLDMFDGRGLFSVLHIKRLELRVPHPPQPLRVFEHLRVGFVLSRFVGSLIDGPASVHSTLLMAISSLRPREERIVTGVQINTPFPWVHLVARRSRSLICCVVKRSGVRA
jgi:hypothetical protein